jgi:hypothetical protein
MYGIRLLLQVVVGISRAPDWIGQVYILSDKTIMNVTMPFQLQELYSIGYDY